MLMSFKKRIKLLYPQATPAQRATIVRSFGAAPLKRVLRPDTHRHGGAVDLTIVDRHGTELWMGTDHDDLTDRAATKYFTLNKNKAEFDRVAARNRNLLVKTLTAAGLRNYHREWWHWYVPTPQELQAEKNSP
jgi:D-alanyl-D-alanine dipeptidase